MTTDEQRQPDGIRAHSSQRRRRTILALSAAAVLVLVLVAGKFYLDHYVQQRLTGEIANILPKIEDRTGLRVVYNTISVGLDGSIIFNRPSIFDAQAPGSPPLLKAGKVEIDFSFDRANKIVTLRGLRLVAPELRLAVSPRGDFNLPPKLTTLLGDGKPRPAGQTANEPLFGSLAEHLRWTDPLKIAYVDGRFDFADQGKLGVQPRQLLSLDRAGGVVTVSPALRQAGWIGQARNAVGSGTIKYEITLNDTGQNARLTFAGFSLEKWAPLAPFGLQIQNGTRLEGTLDVQRPAGGKPWRVGTGLRLNDLGMNHPRLALQPVTGLSLASQGELMVDWPKKSVQARELKLWVGKTPIRLQDLAIDALSARGPSIRMQLHLDRLRLQDLLDSLPESLIPVVKGSLVEGTLDLHGSLALDLDKPERSGLELSGGVTEFKAVFIPPRCDARAIARPDFKHLARKHGLLKKTILVGPANPDFIPLDDMGPYLRGAVLTCEDGSFMTHHGFMLRHINDSLRRDMRERRFVRGASTISMQLAKNLFLSEEKTISRKLQEVMLTWYLEHEIDKKRLLEVYLNIIEWGPDIYGVGPAARHYFHRHPGKLLPIQAAYLASVIMNPVRFYYMKARGQVSEGWRINLAFILEKMRQRGTITQEEFDLAAAHDFEVPFGDAVWAETPVVSPDQAGKASIVVPPVTNPDQTDMLELKEDGSGLTKTPE